MLYSVTQCTEFNKGFIILKTRNVSQYKPEDSHNFVHANKKSEAFHMTVFMKLISDHQHYMKHFVNITSYKLDNKEGNKDRNLNRPPSKICLSPSRFS